MEIELIAEIAHAPIHKVTAFHQQGDKVAVTATWTQLPMWVASGEMSFASRQNAPGTSYTTNVFARIAYKIKDIPHSILRIKLCSGRILIVGTPYLPVLPTQNSTLSLTTITVNHNSIDPPLELMP